MQVIGAGLGRTGTYSLMLALEKLLGGPCYHMAKVFDRPADVALWKKASEGGAVDWKSMFAEFKAGVDWPICAFAVDLVEVYPDALILLSNRDFESWWKSASTTIFPSSGQAEGEWRDMVEALFGNTFTSELDNKEACRAAFERHYRHVRENIPAERLLEWTAADGWAPICDALGLAVPDEAFPHTNTTEEFLRRRRPQPSEG